MAQTFSDVTTHTFEYRAIVDALKAKWISPESPTTFGYGNTLLLQDWLHILMFLRTNDACPEFGMVPNAYWTPENIRGCLSGVGVPITTALTEPIRRDEAMQQLFALRRQSFAFQQRLTKPPGFIDPEDLHDIPLQRQGAMIAADRLKLLFRSHHQLLPASPLLKEDGVLAVWRFREWERQGGADRESNDRFALSKDATLHHWRDLDTDIYVIQVKTGGDTVIHPILPRRSFNPAKDPTTETIRDEYVYETVSTLAKESGAIAAINGSYFNTEWPWGALEDVVIMNGKTLLDRKDRSTFVICKDGKLYIGRKDDTLLKQETCVPEYALGAGPLFLSQGGILTQSTKEGFDEYTQWERRVGKNARTAIGISADRKTAYLIVVAGKSYPAFGRGGSSLGAFLKEKYPDMRDAMMYDGGGSSTLYAKNRLLVGLGESGKNGERAVISALGIFSRKAEARKSQQFKKEQKKRWDNGFVTIKIEKPKEAYVWQDIQEAKKAGVDLITYDKSSNLTVTRRQGTHEQGWKIPTEIHVIDHKTKTDIDIIRLFTSIPDAQRPDLKTFVLLAFRPTGIVFGDATGRFWFYYTKDQQLSPAKFIEKSKQNRHIKKPRM